MKNESSLRGVLILLLAATAGFAASMVTAGYTAAAESDTMRPLGVFGFGLFIFLGAVCMFFVRAAQTANR
jgi:hypothetical protein